MILYSKMYEAVLQVHLHSVLLHMHCQTFQYCILTFNSQKYIYYTQKYLNGKTEVSILLQEGSCSACRSMKCRFCGSVVN